MATPVDPLAVIGRRLRDRAREIGLVMEQFSVAPDLDGGPARAHVAFSVAPEPPPKPEADPEFDALIAAQAEHEAAERAARAAQELTVLHDRLSADLGDPSKGLGLDDE